MDERTIREFVARDWQKATDAKSEYWALLFRDNPRAVWESAQALLAHVRRIRPAFPDEQRDADLSAHLALRSRLDRAADAFRSGSGTSDVRLWTRLWPRFRDPQRAAGSGQHAVLARCQLPIRAG